MDTSKVTRVEVIDKEGRRYVRYNAAVELHLQDDDRTLKIFVCKGQKTEWSAPGWAPSIISDLERR